MAVAALRKRVLFIGITPPPLTSLTLLDHVRGWLGKREDSAGVIPQLDQLHELFNVPVVKARFELSSQLHVTIDELPLLVQQRRPHILHISGHGFGGRLVFQNAFGRSEALNVKALVDRIRGMGIDGIILDGCGTASTLRSALDAHVDGPWFALRHSLDVRVLDSWRFTRDFYLQLASTGKLGDAVEAVRMPLAFADR